MTASVVFALRDAIAANLADSKKGDGWLSIGRFINFVVKFLLHWLMATKHSRLEPTSGRLCRKGITHRKK